MHGAVPMCSGERGGDLRAELQDRTKRQQALRHTDGERLTFEKLHDEVVDLCFATDVEEGANMRVRNSGHGARFLLDA
jgi:hypothetical protein